MDVYIPVYCSYRAFRSKGSNGSWLDNGNNLTQIRHCDRQLVRTWRTRVFNHLDIVSQPISRWSSRPQARVPLRPSTSMQKERPDELLHPVHTHTETLGARRLRLEALNRLRLRASESVVPNTGRNFDFSISITPGAYCYRSYLHISMNVASMMRMIRYWRKEIDRILNEVTWDWSWLNLRPISKYRISW